MLFITNYKKLVIKMDNFVAIFFKHLNLNRIIIRKEYNNIFFWKNMTQLKKSTKQYFILCLKNNFKCLFFIVKNLYLFQK